MGAGKGQVRRARQEPTIVGSMHKDAGATYDWRPWLDFIQGRGLENVSSTRYYLGQGTPPRSDEEASKVLMELFLDSVAVGALKIPSPYTAEDFQIEVSGRRTLVSFVN